MTDDMALALLRIVVGLLFVGHGAQKLFGWFGGHGPNGTGQYLGSMRLKEPKLAAYLVGGAELLGGALLTLGLLTSVGCAAILAVMLGAIFLAHWPKFWVTDGGFEYPLVNVAIVTFYGLMGPGAWSLDEAFGAEDVLSRPWTYVIAACAAIVAVAGMLATREPSHEQWKRPADEGSGGQLASQGR